MPRTKFTEVDMVDEVLLLASKRRTVEEEDCFDAIDANKRLRDQVADDICEVLPAVADYLYDKKGLEVLEYEEDFDKAAKILTDLIMGKYIISMKDIADRLPERLYNQYYELSDTFDDFINAGKRSRVRGRDNRNDRGRAGRGGRRDSGRGRGMEVRSRNRGRRDDRDDKAASATQYRNTEPPARERSEPTSRRRRKDTTPVEEAVSSVVHKQQNVIYDARMFGMAKEGRSAGLLVEKDETDMESYNEHELTRGLGARDRSGKIIVPAFDYRKIASLEDDVFIEAAKAAKIVTSEAQVFYSNEEWPINIISDFTASADYVISESIRYSTINVPTSILGKMEPQLSAIANFTDLYKVIVSVQEVLANTPVPEERNVWANMQHMVSALLRIAVRMTNDVFAMTIKNSTEIADFLVDFPELIAWLNSEGADLMPRFRKIEQAYFATNFIVVVTPESETALDGADVINNAGEATRPVLIGAKVLTVKTFGAVLSEQLQVVDRTGYTLVERKYSPDFYDACKRLFAYRNKTCPYASLFLTDITNTNMKLTSDEGDASHIKSWLM